LAYVTPSDPLLTFAAYGGLAVLFATVALLAAIAAIRYLVDRRLAAERRLNKLWLPVFFGVIEGLPVTPPRISARDREAVLMAWIQSTESIRGEARSRLRRFALDLGFDRTARELLTKSNMRARLLAIAAMGRLGMSSSWDDLAVLGHDETPTISLLAMRSLLQIDAVRGVPLLFRMLHWHAEWPASKVAAMLGDVPHDLLGAELADAIRTARPDVLARLLKVADLQQAGDLWPVLEPLLDGSRQEEVIIGALKASDDPRSIDAIRRLVIDSRWTVRAQAAAALGRLGLPEDRLRLQAMLADPDWWVRYRAAQALVRLPSSRRADLEALCVRLGDHPSRDMLRQALAEAA